MMVSAYKGKTVKQWLMDLARVRLAEMEKRENPLKNKNISEDVFLSWANKTAQDYFSKDSKDK